MIRLMIRFVFLKLFLAVIRIGGKNLIRLSWRRIMICLVVLTMILLFEALLIVVLNGLNVLLIGLGKILRCLSVYLVRLLKKLVNGLIWLILLLNGPFLAFIVIGLVLIRVNRIVMILRSLRRNRVLRFVLMLMILLMSRPRIGLNDLVSLRLLLVRILLGSLSVIVIILLMQIVILKLLLLFMILLLRLIGLFMLFLVVSLVVKFRNLLCLLPE